MKDLFVINLWAKFLRINWLRSCWQLLLIIVMRPLYLLGYLFPTNSNIIVFGNVFGYKDNARYLYEYVHKTTKFRAIWISSKQNIKTREYIGENYSKYSFKGIYFQYIANIAFLSTGKGDLAKFTLANKILIQLWHGIPIKRILLDSPETIPLAKNNFWLKKMATKLLKRDLNKYDAVIASSPVVQSRLMSAFGLGENKVVIMGYPRHDIILKHAGEKCKRILYAPTWRSNITEADEITRKICNKKFVQSVQRLGYELWVSIHLLNAEIETLLRNELDGDIHFVKDLDINILMAQSEILITDYSSVAIDFSILNRQIIYFAPDLDYYLQSRGLYNEFETIIRNNAVVSPEQVISKIKHQSDDIPIREGLYFQWHDMKSRERILSLIFEKYAPQNATV